MELIEECRDAVDDGREEEAKQLLLEMAELAEDESGDESVLEALDLASAALAQELPELAEHNLLVARDACRALIEG